MLSSTKYESRVKLTRGTSTSTIYGLRAQTLKNWLCTLKSQRAKRARRSRSKSEYIEQKISGGPKREFVGTLIFPQNPKPKKKSVRTKKEESYSKNNNDKERGSADPASLSRDFGGGTSRTVKECRWCIEAF